MCVNIHTHICMCMCLLVLECVHSGRFPSTDAEQISLASTGSAHQHPLLLVASACPHRLFLFVYALHVRLDPPGQRTCHTNKQNSNIVPNHYKVSIRVAQLLPLTLLHLPELLTTFYEPRAFFGCECTRAARVILSRFAALRIIFFNERYLTLAHISC